MRKNVIVGGVIGFLSIASVCVYVVKHKPGTTVVVSNESQEDVTVYVAFGSNSVIVPTSWAFCKNPSGLTCDFVLAKKTAIPLPLSGQYLNATFSFKKPVGCGASKAELNVNNPKWYDITDVSLVDGFNGNIEIEVDGTKLGPTRGAGGNEKVLGVFPYGCDICVARQSPPCGIKPGIEGCKTGSQYNPDVPCQHQGTKMGDGSSIRVMYFGG